MDIRFSFTAHKEMHFRESHFFCEEEICLEKKFVVFETEVDLKAHQVGLMVILLLITYECFYLGQRASYANE